MRRILYLAIALWAATSFSHSGLPARASDWPTWRHDANRSAATSDDLPETLRPVWERDLGRPNPAWPNENRLHFDMCYEPIVAGRSLFVASNRNDKIYALDSRTGREKWSFFAGGPIRFAPAAWDQYVYFVCDDGFLYCLDAEDGKLNWKVRGGPPGDLLLGNGRLISEWPARGGPVVKDGVVYFGAGIWLSYGTFIHAVDAKSGKIIWTNDSADAITIPVARKKHGKTGIAPHGYLTIVGQRLIVPNGRTMPGVFDLKTGELVKFHPGQRSGNVFVAGMGDYYFVGQRMFQMETGVVMYNTLGKLLHPPVLTPEAFFLVKRPGRGQDVAGRARWNVDVFRGQTLGGLGGSPGEGYSLVCYRFADARPFDDVKRTIYEQYKGGDYGLREVLAKYEHGSLAPVPWPVSLPLDSVHLKAGRRLYGVRGGKIVAAELAPGNAAVKKAWESDIEGKVGSMIAADDRLYVSTIEGRLYCFGAGEGGGGRAATGAQPSATATPSAAKQILASAGVTKGYAVVLGADDPQFLAALATGSQLHIIAVEKDAVKVAAAREHLDAAGLYGRRVAVIEADPETLQLPRYMANLVVSGGKDAMAQADVVRLIEQHFRSVRPYGGTFCLKASSSPASLAGALGSLKQEGMEVKAAGDFTLIVRAGPLPGAANWTQHDAGAGNSLVSADTRVRTPLKVLWFGGEADGVPLLYHHSMPPRPQVVDGRMFVATFGRMCAIDVYTGRVLWERRIDGLADAYRWLARAKGVRVMGDFYASTPDGVYAISGKECFRLDPATGRIVGTFTVPASAGGRPLAWTSIRIWQDILIATVDVPLEGEATAKTSRTRESRLSASRYLLAVDRRSGELKWIKEAQLAFPHKAVAAGGGKVFCIDRASPVGAELYRRPGAAAGQKAVLLALDISTGETVWSADDNINAMYLRYSEEADVLVHCPEPRGASVTCYRGKDGARLWQGAMGKSRGRDVAVFADRLAMAGTWFQLKTGARTGRSAVPSNTSCADFTVAANTVIMRHSGTIGFADLKSGRSYQFPGTRPGCVNNAIPAAGVLTMPNQATTCICNYHNQTSIAFVHDPGPGE